MSGNFPLLDTHADIAPEPAQECAVENFSIRILKPSDCTAFRAIRLEALAGTDAKYFGTSYEEEKAQSDSEWNKRCTETEDQAVFGLFFQDNLVGIMAATKWDGDKYGRSLLWGSAYMKKGFRRRHHAEGLYKKRLEWSLAHSQFERVVLFIRDGNEIATQIHVKNGARYTHSAPMRFADGKVAQAHWYQRPLLGSLTPAA